MARAGDDAVSEAQIEKVGMDAGVGVNEDRSAVRAVADVTVYRLRISMSYFMPSPDTERRHANGTCVRCLRSVIYGYIRETR